MRTPVVITALLGLAACSAAPTVSPPLPVASGTVLSSNSDASKLGGDVPSGLPYGNAAPITYNGSTIAGVIKSSNISNGSFGGAQKIAADGQTFDVVAFSDDGVSTLGQSSIISATTIGASKNSGLSPNGLMQIAKYDRQTNSVLPTSGGGTFTGLYRGTMGTTDGSAFKGYGAGTMIATKGNLSLTADFVGKTVSGTITGHTGYLANGAGGPNLGDVTLTQTAITANGSYIDSATSSQASGTYEGLIGGPNGTGTAGALKLSSGVISEIGVFTGKRP